MRFFISGLSLVYVANREEWSHLTVASMLFYHADAWIMWFNITYALIRPASQTRATLV